MSTQWPVKIPMTARNPTTKLDPGDTFVRPDQTGRDKRWEVVCWTIKMEAGGEVVATMTCRLKKTDL